MAIAAHSHETQWRSFVPRDRGKCGGDRRKVARLQVGVINDPDVRSAE